MAFDMFPHTDWLSKYANKIFIFMDILLKFVDRYVIIEVTLKTRGFTYGSKLQ